jgi:hypothetical protein
VTVVGDIGQTDDSFLTLDHMLQDTNASFAVIVGDVSYAGDSCDSCDSLTCIEGLMWFVSAATPAAREAGV